MTTPTTTFWTRAATLFGVAIVSCLTMSASTQTNRSGAQDYLQQGVQAFQSAQYALAAENFKRAIDLDPSLTRARLYLATAYANQFIPGAKSEDNIKMGQEAIDQFKEVLKDDPSNLDSIAGIASLYFSMSRLDDAKEWYEKQIQLDPKNAEAYYSVGVIAWKKVYPARMKARADSLIDPLANTPFTDDATREALCRVNLPIIESGFKNLNKAVDLRPDYDDAMAYINLLYREKADCEAGIQDRVKDLEAAKLWVDKAIETKKKKAAAAGRIIP